jgi:polyisoprenoid-binding protein YceI
MQKKSYFKTRGYPKTNEMWQSPGNPMKKSIFSAFLLAYAATHSAVAAETYEIDPIHSFVQFKVTRLGAEYVYGRFTGGLSGMVLFDSAAPDRSTVALEAKTETLDTGFAQRDKDIKGPDFLNVKQFPVATFKSKSVQKVTDEQYTVTDDLTFHGVTKPLMVQANIVGQGKGTKGELLTGAEVHFTINRSEYGVNYGLPGLGDDVELTVAVGAVRK